MGHIIFPEFGDGGSGRNCDRFDDEDRSGKRAGGDLQC
jgi:hypothetical protein